MRGAGGDTSGGRQREQLRRCGGKIRARKRQSVSFKQTISRMCVRYSWLRRGVCECIKQRVDVRNFTSRSGGREQYLRLFNLLISRPWRYYAHASEKFICFLWSAVDGRLMKHKPCFCRNTLQSGADTRLPALKYAPLVSQPSDLCSTDPVRTPSSVHRE